MLVSRILTSSVHRGRSAGTLGLALALFLVRAGSGLAQPAWYDPKTMTGVKPCLPDFYQHQGYVADPNSSWESSQPSPIDCPQLTVQGGWCRPTAVADCLTYWDQKGYPGLVRPDIKTPGKWLDAANKTIQDLEGPSTSGGLQGYLDGKYAADQAGPKMWKSKLVFNQYTVNSVTGGVKNSDGKTLRQDNGMGGKVAISAYDTIARLLLNGQDVMLKLTAAPDADPSLWWRGTDPGSYHYVTVAGVDLKNNKLLFADPDSNKGNKSGDAGWNPFPQPPMLVDCKTGAPADTTKGYTLVTFEDGMVKMTDVNGGGPKVTEQKKGDPNVDARKYKPADPVPVPMAPKVSDPKTYNSQYGTMMVKNMDAKTGFTVTASDDKDGNITAMGRYKDVKIAAIETVCPNEATPLAPVPNVNGLKTEVKVVSGIVNPVDKIQLAAVGNLAKNDPSIDNHFFNSTDGGMWQAHFLAANAVDGFGNMLSSGGWEYDLVSGPALAPFDPMSLSPADVLDAFVETMSPLTQYDVEEHIQATTDSAGNMFGDYWQDQSIGAPEMGFPDQKVAVAPPEPQSLILLAVGGLLLKLARRGRRA